MQSSETGSEALSPHRARRHVMAWLTALGSAVHDWRRIPAMMVCCTFLLLAGVQTSVAAPSIDFLDPDSGSTAGGTFVTINGAEFGAVQGDIVGVTFGGVAVQSFELLSIAEPGTQIGVFTPAHPAGTVDVVVTVTGGVATKTAAFTYVAPPVLTGVSPDTGAPAGGEALTIQGSNLATAFSVEFGTCADDSLFGPSCDPSFAATIVSKTDTGIVVTAPALAEGTYDVLVTTDYGATILADAYTATSTTAVSSVTIEANPLIAGQGTTVTATFTSTTALAAGDTITVKLTGYSFPAGAKSVIVGAGFPVGTSLSGTVAAEATDTVVVTVGAGGTVAGSFATIGIPATNPAAGTLAKSGLTVATSKDTRATASSADIVIAPAPITGVAFTPSSLIAGADITLKVDFTDPLALATGNTITLGYTGFVVPASGLVATGTGFSGDASFTVDSASAGSIAVTVTGTAAAGSARSLTLSGAGLRNPASAGTIARSGLTVRTTATPTPVAAAADVVITAPPPRLVFTTQPAGCVVNSPCFVQPRVAVEDANGNRIPSSASITLTKKSGPGTLTCTVNPVSAVAGLATFSGCTLDQADDYVLTASATGVTSGDSTTFTVSQTRIMSLDPDSTTRFLEDEKCCTSSEYWNEVRASSSAPRDLRFSVTPPPGVLDSSVEIAFKSSSPPGLVSRVVDLSNPSFGPYSFAVLTEPDAFGDATLTFSARVNGEEVETLDVPITVVPVNDPPSASFKDGKTHFVLAQGQSSLTVPGFVAATSPGPANEGGQSVSLRTGTGLGPGGSDCAPPPTIGMDGTLTFQSIPGPIFSSGLGCNYAVILEDNGEGELPCDFLDSLNGATSGNSRCRIYLVSYAHPERFLVSRPGIYRIQFEVAVPTKTSPTPDVSLVLSVTNRGNFLLQGVRLQAAPPSGLASTVWTCSTPQGDCTPTSGSGAIDVLFDLDVGEEAEFTASGSYRGASFFSFQPQITLPDDLPADTVVIDFGTPTRFVVPANSAGVFLGDFEGN